MGVRNCKDIGENLRKIIWRLMQNKDLIKLLYYTDINPLSHDIIAEARSKYPSEVNDEDAYNKFCANEIFEKLVKIVPRVGPKETANSILAIQIQTGHRNPGNGEFRNIGIVIESFVPLTQWLINDDQLRPFYILGEVQKSLADKTINGLGKLEGGDFDINFLTDEISCYEQTFQIINYE